MKKINLFALLISLFLNYSCKQENLDYPKEDDLPFKFTAIDKDGFKQVGNSFQYQFKCEMKNISDVLYEEVYTTLEVEFILENDTTLTEKDYRDVLSIYTGFGDLEKGWKKNDIRSIGDKHILESDYIPKHFKEYPIKKVIAYLIFNCKDLVNKKSEQYYLGIDITSSWRELN